MAIFRFFKYLRPHRLRIAFAIFFMFTFALASAMNLLAAKPLIEIILGIVDIEDYRERRARKIHFSQEDLADPGMLAVWLRDGEDAVAGRLRLRRSDEMTTALLAYDASQGQPDRGLRKLMIDNLAVALADPALFNTATDGGVELSPTAQTLAESEFRNSDPYNSALLNLNRTVIRQSRPGAFTLGFGDAWQERLLPARVWFDHKVEAFYEYAADREQRSRALMGVCIALMIFTVTKAFSEFMSKFLVSHALYSSMLKIKEDLFAHIIRQDHAFFMAHSTGFLESRINSDVRSLNKVFDSIIRDAIQQPLTLLSLFAVLMIFSWKLTLLAFIALPIAAVPIAYFSRRLRKLTRKSQSKTDDLTSYAEESLRNYRVVKVYDSEEFEVDRFRQKNAEVLKYVLKRRLASFAQSPVIEIMGSIAAIIVLQAGLYLVNEQEVMTGSTFMVYLICLTQFYSPVRKLTKVNVNWQIGRVSAERILEIFEMTSLVQDKADAAPLERVNNGIRFEKVSFRYGEIDVVRDVSLDIPLGKVVAIVGPSGAGKSSLVGLLPRLYDPTEGAILIDEKPADGYRLSDLRRCFGVVSQETTLFNDTVARNIAYAEPGEIDLERVETAARQAHAHEFIMALDGELGYETSIGQAGGRLSGGQRQRIAIARAIYRDPQILIFDEATSALDEESQRHVQQAIDNLLKGRTAIVIAHRLSTVRHADEIVVMDAGRVVERGAHDELMKQNGLYWRLYQSGDLGGQEDPSDTD